MMPSKCSSCNANISFEETVANAAILRLHTAVLWAEVSKCYTVLIPGNESVGFLSPLWQFQRI